MQPLSYKESSDRASRTNGNYNYYISIVKVAFFFVESISRESDEIRLSPSQQRERETIRYRPANNKKKSRAPSREDATFGHA